MKLFNSNFIHNCLNATIAVICGGALAGFDWTMFGVDDRTALQISGVLALLKLVINAVRDGPAGMVEAPPSSLATEVARTVDAELPKGEAVEIVTPGNAPNILVKP